MFSIAEYIKRLKLMYPNGNLPATNTQQNISGSQVANLNQDIFKIQILDECLINWPASVNHEIEGTFESFDLPIEHDIMIYSRSLSCFVLEVNQTISLNDAERQCGSLISYQGKVHKIDHINTEDYSKPRVYLKLFEPSDKADEGESDGNISP